MAQPDNAGLSFYPLTVGNYWIYDVDMIEYLPLGNDTSSFQVREVISDSIVTDLGEVTYLLNKEVRLDTLSPWRVDSLFSVRKSNQFVARTENNVTTVKLVFPVAVEVEWNPNALNNNGQSTYRYVLASDEDVALSSLAFDIDNAVKVVQSDIVSPIIGTDQRSEVYVDDVGLIKRDQLVLELCTSESDCETLGEIISGVFLSQLLIEYGSL